MRIKHLEIVSSSIIKTDFPLVKSLLLFAMVGARSPCPYSQKQTQIKKHPPFDFKEGAIYLFESHYLSFSILAGID
jgi:hypothetical protein